MNEPNLSFDEYGFLTPYSVIPADIDTLQRVFVSEFPTSATRQRLFARFEEFTVTLSELLPGGYTQWVDGSFVSQKKDPRDIDVLTFVDYRLHQQHQKQFDALSSWHKTQVQEVQAFFVSVYPPDHRQRYLYESDLIQWEFDWSRTRTLPRRKKGIIELTF
ncbi:MAG: hypothetical protein EAZ91_23655 [Cytophagales bacterium]|nr:MAG: hypothetical protein EAZ91_23655 [Cytophagales bacterium]